MATTFPVPAPGENASTALALANTRIEGPHGAVELLEDVGAMNEWLRRSLSAHIPHATPDDLKRVTELRAGIRAAFLSAASGQAPVAASISELNRAAAADPGAPQLIWVDRSPRVVWAGSDAGGAHGVLASVARDAIAVLASGAVMRQCAAPDCDRLFIPDHGRRIWCSTSCGNRVRGSRHYALNKKVGTRPDG